MAIARSLERTRTVSPQRPPATKAATFKNRHPKSTPTKIAPAYSVSASDRRIAQKYPNEYLGKGENTNYHSSTTKPRVVKPVKVSTRVGSTAAMPGGPTAIKGGAKQKTSTKWIKNIAAQKVNPTKFSAYKVAPGEASRQTAAQAQVDRAQQGDWGLNAAALAQVGLIKDWTNEAVDAAGESEIGRGMGRSGSYDAVRVDAAQEGAMQAASQMANASAEQGRLNQEVAVKNAELGTQVNLENASMINDYAQFLRSQGLEEYKVQQEVNLAYKEFDEGRRQFNENHALDTTKSERGYQQERLGFNENVRQFNEQAGTARYGAQTDRFGAQSNDRLGWAGLAEQAAARNQSDATTRAGWAATAASNQQAASMDPAYINALTAQRKVELGNQSTVYDQLYGPKGAAMYSDQYTPGEWAAIQKYGSPYGYTLSRNAPMGGVSSRPSNYR